MITTELAEKIGIQATSIHRRVCVSGSYFGLRPTRMANGRLQWPDDSVEQLMALKSTPAKDSSHAQA